MAAIAIGMAREVDPGNTDGDHGLRPRPLYFTVLTEEVDRVASASQEELDQFARNMIANYLCAQATSIDADPAGDFLVENVRFDA